jgi:hypothetical protein
MSYETKPAFDPVLVGTVIGDPGAGIKEKVCARLQIVTKTKRESSSDLMDVIYVNKDSKSLLNLKLIIFPIINPTAL